MAVTIRPMKRSDFSYHLPQHLIAQHPLPERSASRLMCLDTVTAAIAHRRFQDLPELLEAGDLLVFNNTRVIPARLWGRKDSGGRVEVLIERMLSQGRALAHVRASKSPKPGTRIILSVQQDGPPTPRQLRVVGRRGELFELESVAGDTFADILAAVGHMPLPPYIAREDEALDQERYQTVYASEEGAVAAPTAGLHFDQALLEKIEAMGVATTAITLHVGAGTFQPVRTDDIRQHQMHSEYLEVSTRAVAAVNEAQKRGGRVIAVGTTAVRALESASGDNGLAPFYGDTDIFIFPGYRFRTVDALITNFHLPESTLLMLVSAYAGREVTFKAYREAVLQEYRFFSYGDAMFVYGGQR